MMSYMEMRRRAPLHYLSRAKNARFIAYMLSEGRADECLSRLAAALPYSGTPRVASHEAFRREAAIALELIIKAVIALKIERGIAPAHVTRVRTVHDLPTLWRDAGIKSLSADDQRLLLEFKRILYWSGRYPAPKDDDALEKEHQEMRSVKPAARTDLASMVRAPKVEWKTFDRLFRIALDEYARNMPDL